MPFGPMYDVDKGVTLPFVRPPLDRPGKNQTTFGKYPRWEESKNYEPTHSLRERHMKTQLAKETLKNAMYDAETTSAVRKYHLQTTRYFIKIYVYKMRLNIR